ncbi:MAG: PAS domain S-box protein [Bacteroidetes bacterium]|nr:PAS domain S-box protein [Bacteroidota bacterium]
MTNIDITSVSILIIIVNVLQVAGLLFQFILNRSYKGNGWWLMWSISIATGFIFLQLRVIPGLTQHAILFQNIFLLLGLVFLYIGIMRFLGRRENSVFIYAGYIIYDILITYFLYFEDNVHIRSIIFAAGLVFLSFITAYSLIKYKDESVRFSSNFLGTVMYIHGGFYVIRLLYLFANPQLGNYMSQDWTTVFQYLFGLVVGLLYTFSLIFMVNQKLSYEMKTAKEHFEAIFKTSPDAVVITSLRDGKILNINDAFTKITGYTREDSLGKTTLGLMERLHKKKQDGKRAFSQ